MYMVVCENNAQLENRKNGDTDAATLHTAECKADYQQARLFSEDKKVMHSLHMYHNTHMKHKRRNREHISVTS